MARSMSLRALPSHGVMSSWRGSGEPTDATCWYQEGPGGYEHLYTTATVADIPVGTRMNFPVTFKLKDGDEVTRTDGLTDYTQADAPSQLPDRAGVVAMYRKRWLDYTRYSSYHGFLSWGTSSQDSSENYEEYFISKFQG